MVRGERSFWPATPNGNPGTGTGDQRLGRGLPQAEDGRRKKTRHENSTLAIGRSHRVFRRLDHASEEELDPRLPRTLLAHPLEKDAVGLAVPA